LYGRVGHCLLIVQEALLTAKTPEKILEISRINFYFVTGFYRFVRYLYCIRWKKVRLRPDV
uniref:hypothetical protein n=1 Tax=Prevotella sp. TaxID=59823 RepID=UPI0040297901